MSSGAPLPPGRRSEEALPLFPADASPTMGSLKHRAGQGSLGDVTVPHALADERGGSGGPAPTGGLSGLAPVVMLCVAVASMGAFSFGYALGVVNGPLGALSSSLGFGGDAFRQGLVRQRVAGGRQHARWPLRSRATCPCRHIAVPSALAYACLLLATLCGSLPAQLALHPPRNFCRWSAAC